jgi:hypothetical protein
MFFVGQVWALTPAQAMLSAIVAKRRKIENRCIKNPSQSNLNFENIIALHFAL